MYAYINYNNYKLINILYAQNMYIYILYAFSVFYSQINVIYSILYTHNFRTFYRYCAKAMTIKISKTT